MRMFKLDFSNVVERKIHLSAFPLLRIKTQIVPVPRFKAAHFHGIHGLERKEIFQKGEKEKEKMRRNKSNADASTSFINHRSFGESVT